MICKDPLIINANSLPFLYTSYIMTLYPFTLHHYFFFIHVIQRSMISPFTLCHNPFFIYGVLNDLLTIHKIKLLFRHTRDTITLSPFILYTFTFIFIHVIQWLSTHSQHKIAHSSYTIFIEFLTSHAMPLPFSSYIVYNDPRHTMNLDLY